MKVGLFALASVLTMIGGALILPAEENVEDLLSDLDRIQLSLGGAGFSFWITPEKGLTVIYRPETPDSETGEDVLAVFGEQGQLVFERSPADDIPELSGAHISDTTIRAPGKLVLAAVTEEENYDFILAEYDLDKNKLIGRVSTKPIWCRSLHSDSEGTIWCLGIDTTKRKNDLDYDLVYRYDESGQLLGSSLPRSTFPDSPNPLALKDHHRETDFLAGDGITRLWLPAAHELISFNPDGTVLDRLTLPAVENLSRAQLVTAPGNRVFASLAVAADPDVLRTHSLFRLSSDGTSWVPVEDPSLQFSTWYSLVGADQDGLILLDQKRTALLWYPVAEEETEGQPSNDTQIGFGE